jgi:hypothetical protein
LKDGRGNVAGGIKISFIRKRSACQLPVTWLAVTGAMFHGYRAKIPGCSIKFNGLNCIALKPATCNLQQSLVIGKNII